MPDTSNASIRPAQTHDLDAIAELYRVLLAEMAALQPKVWQPGEMSHSFIMNLITGARSSVLVAEKNGEVVGFAVVQDRDAMPRGGLVKTRFCFLLDIVVAREYRRQGLGRALVAGAENWARARGLSWLELNVLSENTDALQLYEQMGLNPAQHTLRKML